MPRPEHAEVGAQPENQRAKQDERESARASGARKPTNRPFVAVPSGLSDVDVTDSHRQQLFFTLDLAPVATA